MSMAMACAAAAGATAAAGVIELLAARLERSPTGTTGSAPRPLTTALARLGRPLGVRAPRDLGARMEAAGLDGARAGDLGAAKVGGAVLAGLAAVVLGGALPGHLGLVAVVAAPAGAFVAPDLLLRRRTRTRAAALARELPDVLDLLRVTVQAGLSPVRAMREVGTRAHGLLAAELREAARRAALGVPTEVVLDRLGQRCPLPAALAMVTVLRRAVRNGAPLAPTLAALSTDARAERARVLREGAAKAAPKIQLVVALALVPGVLLLLAAMLLPRVA